VVRSVEECCAVEFPKVADPRGNLTFVEGGRHIPFAIRSADWIHGVPGGEKHGGHGYRRRHEVIIALSGSFEVHLSDGTLHRRHLLSRAYVGLYVPSMIWRELESFSTNAVCLILASAPPDESDHIHDPADVLVQPSAST
jgi:hypothetical protein